MAVHASSQRGGETLFSDGFEPVLVSRASFEWRVLERLTYGATPDEADAFVALGANDSDRLSAWLDGQLAPDTLDDSACSQRIAAAGFATLDKTVAQLWADHIRGTAPRGQPVRETQAARLIRAVCSRRQLYERMVEFWHDHFNVYGWDFTIQALFGDYDANVIRPNALGNFRTLLEQVARSPAMLFYLDNKSSRGSDFNENFARELLELHTMGVAAYFPTINPFEVPTDADGPVGYCDNDVYEAARAFTGWTLADDHWEFPDTSAFDTGEFLYYADWHDVAGKLFLQTFLVSNQPALKDGRDVLDLLAAHPATARHVCRKLAVALVSDDPPQELVDGAAALFRAQWQAPDQIAQVVRFLIESPAAFDPESGKRRRPFEHIVAMLRKTGAEPVPVNLSDWNPWGEFFHRLRQTGHGPFRWRTPDGFPDVASAWETTSVMGQTWRLLSRLPQLDDGAGDPILPILDVTRAALAPSARTPVRLVDFWLDRVLGRAPLDARRQELIDFMRQTGPPDQVLDLDTDAPFGFWSSSDLSQHYNGARLNAMVGLAFMLPEAHQR